MAGHNSGEVRTIPPDGGWGWFVCLASFTLQALTIGITYTFGVLFVDLLAYFGESESDTAWIGSIQPCLLYLTGIVAGPLIKKFGWRIVTICGAILSAFGFAVSALAPNIYVLYFTYGVLTGIGNGLMYVTSMVAVQHYFERRRAMATGLAVSGSGVGTLTFGFLTRYLLDQLGWRWTLVIEGGIMLLGVVCGLLYRPLPVISDEEDGVEGTERTALTASNKDNSVSEHNSKNYNTITNNLSVADDDDETNPGCCLRCCTVMKQIFDFSLFKNPVFIIFCTTIVLFCFGYHVPYTYTPERANKMFGIDLNASSMLVSIMGIANVGSRLLFGWCADRSKRIRFYVGGVVLTLGGVISILVFLFTTYPLMVFYSVMFGAFSGCWASLFPVILVDLLGIELIEKSLGQSLACGSIAFLVASPMSGYIIEKTGSYDAPFLVVGIAQTAGGLIYFFCKICQRRFGYQPMEIPPQQILRKRYVSESFS